MRTPHRCWAEVDLDALRENLAWIRHRAGLRVKVVTVVKADAYGHGLKPIAGLLMQSGTDIFGVANLTEAQAIRSVGQGWPILMLGACLPEEVGLAVRDDVMPTISTPAEVARFSAAAKRARKTCNVHVKIDTGMGRLGVRPENALDLIGKIRSSPHLALQGIYTHFASVEDDAEFSRQQVDTFKTVIREIKAAGVRVPLVHANNSGAVLLERGSIYNAVRPGLLVFGIIPPGRRPVECTVRPALSWKCKVTLVREVARGTRLSYGGTFTAPKKMRVATLSAGYGDGYLRAGSNRAQVLIRGVRCPVVGRITMDQMLADVSQVPKVSVSDEVALIGGNISANDVAAWAGTIPWEVLTAITYRVPRVYRGSQAC
jgi:alanine racemase